MPSVYIYVLADYNAGAMVGDWIDVSNLDEDELRDACARLRAKSKASNPEELSIADYDGFYGLTPSLSNVIETARLLDEHGEAYASALLMQRFFTNLKQGLEARDALQDAQNYIRTITVAELRQSELGRKALGELARLEEGKELPPEAELDCEESTTPLAHPVYWGAWICQGKTTAIQ